jgi:hypothetical protein
MVQVPERPHFWPRIPAYRSDGPDYLLRCQGAYKGRLDKNISCIFWQPPRSVQQMRWQQKLRLCMGSRERDKHIAFWELPANMSARALKRV